MQGGTDWQIQIPYHPDTGAESADPADVRSIWISSEGTEAGADYEYRAGEFENRGIQETDGGRTGGTLPGDWEILKLFSAGRLV